MSNRVLAILGALAFMILFYAQTDAIRRAAGFHPACPTLNAPNPPSLHRLEAFTLQMVNELALRNELELAVLNTTHPDLVPELRYKQFVFAVAQMQNLGNLVLLRPLREQFKGDYEQLKARYLAERPGARVPE